MRFDIKTAPMHTTWADMVAVWKAADDIPLFGTAWNFDHFEPIFSDRSGPCLEAWTMLAAMATLTKRIRIGCQVTGTPYRHPALLANMAATVDIASNGRLVLGLGAGWNQDECDALGITLPPLKERFDRFDEALDVISMLLGSADGERVSYEGRYYQLRDAWCEPKCVQRPMPPIAIGGTGEKRTLRTVAKHASHWNAVALDVEEWRRKRGVLHEHCATIGRDPREIECSVNLRFSPTGGTSALVAEVETWVGAGADAVVINLPTPHTPEPLEAIAVALEPFAG